MFQEASGETYVPALTGVLRHPLGLMVAASARHIYCLILILSHAQCHPDTGEWTIPDTDGHVSRSQSQMHSPVTKYSFLLGAWLPLMICPL